MARIELTRRAVVRGGLVTLAGAVAGFLIGRGSDAARAPRAPAAANQYGPAPGAGGRRLVALDAVPEGGAVVVDDAAVVVLRAGGAVRAFSATCTHQGCSVSGLEAGALSCPCHGSRFDPQTGAPVAGPATAPLATVAVEVRDGAVWTA